MNHSVLITPTVSSEDKSRVDAIFNSVQEHMGFIPDGLRLYSISPPLLEAFMGNVGYFMAHEHLSQTLLAMIRYLVSSKANCHFCIDFNAAILMNQGITSEQLRSARANTDDAPINDAEKVLLKLALSAISCPEGISADDIQQAKNQGFSERDIFDVVAIASSNNAFTYVLRTFKVEQQGAFA
ncbi:carboxymuconolactone decarboxylase family protein [sulfur-oxidizing endosymbiont of Gigantopelta aegis]|uniref:carboxymuconolactone decarboxylase family protein n=1 Tax=sulfur-oxidizing endosymbiont of Gigantopelta aegis TaxID=2794934 RepID=UPI0018DC54D0|nr:carboxymuconolactone decarboxylase family protein [sulfur-oxidizing endosymbiont of Gigantopelta aegis]